MFPARYWLVHRSAEVTVAPDGFGCATLSLEIDWVLHNEIVFRDQTHFHIRVAIERPLLGGRGVTWDEIGVIDLHRAEATNERYSQGLNLPNYNCLRFKLSKSFQARGVWAGQYQIALQFHQGAAAEGQPCLPCGFVLGNPHQGVLVHPKYAATARIDLELNVDDPKMKSGKKHPFRLGNTNLARSEMRQGLKLVDAKSGQSTAPFEIESRFGFPLFSASRSGLRELGAEAVEASFQEFGAACQPIVQDLLGTVESANLFLHLASPLLTHQDDAALFLNAIKRSLDLTTTAARACQAATANDTPASIIIGLLGPLEYGFPLGLQRDPNNIKNLALAANYWFSLSEYREESDPQAALADRAAALDLLVNASLRLKIIDRMLRNREQWNRFLLSIEIILETYYDLQARNNLFGVLCYCGLDELAIDYDSIEQFRRELEEKRKNKR